MTDRATSNEEGTVGEHPEGRKARKSRKSTHRRLGVAIVVIAGLALLTAGVMASRRGLITMNFKLGRPVRPVPIMKLVDTVPPADVAESAVSATALVPTVATAEAAVIEPSAPPSTPVAPSKEPASVPAKAARPLACSELTASSNVDPTEGDIRGSTGLPGHVSYYKGTDKLAAASKTCGR